MSVDWSPLKAELAIWRGEARVLPIWWRDDDAVNDTPALAQLTGLAETLGLPVHLAVIPKFAQASLVEVCRSPWAVAMVHGWAHQNHAPEGQKKAEFGWPREGAADEIQKGIGALQQMFGADLVPVFVPPWNRIDAGLIAALPDLGFAGLSTFTPRAARLATPGLVQINTHVDPIYWKGGGGLVPPEVQIAALVQNLQDRRFGRTDNAEPLGFLTHHLVHNHDIWAFAEACLGTLLDAGAVPCNLHDLKGNLP